MKRLLVSMTLFLVAACSDGDDSMDGDPIVETGLQPPTAGRGVQYQMVTEIAAGDEVEHCRFVQAPPEGLLVNRDEVRFDSGSHHFLLYETTYTEIPTQNENGTPVDTSGVFDCSQGATSGWAVTKLIGGSQNGDGQSILAFPPGIAVRIQPNAVLLMNAHYINATDLPLQPEIRVNLHTLDEDELEVEGDVLFLYNPFIKVPAMGTGRARWRCPVHSDITISNLQSHMHQRGVGYAAGLLGEEPFYESTEWEDVTVKSFEPGLVVNAGSTIDYWCDYETTEDRDIYQGPRSTDEMCMLIGSYYPADPATANCLTATGEDFGGDWVGNGTATCAATMGCMQGAFGAGDESAVVQGITDCILASDPAVAAEASAFLRCVASTDAPATECEAQIHACSVK